MYHIGCIAKPHDRKVDVQADLVAVATAAAGAAAVAGATSSPR